MTNSKKVNLALQGGGAHGAFAWGVLDRLLEDGRVTFDAVSATSAGAMNASVLGYGLTIGGAEGAREQLEKFWKKISDEGAKGPLQPSMIDKMMGNNSLDNSPAFMFFDILSRLMSPYELNPMNLNPLRDVLEASSISTCCARVARSSCSCRRPTSDRQGPDVREPRDRPRPGPRLGLPAVPVPERDDRRRGLLGRRLHGQPGDFPADLRQRRRTTSSSSTSTRSNRPEIPKTAKDILNRINEISFNSSLMREMRAIAFVSHLIDDGQLDDQKHRRMLVHSIQDEKFMSSLGVTSKMNSDWRFLKELRDVGRACATKWLDEHLDDVGVRASTDIHTAFL